MWGFTGKDNVENRSEVAATRKMLGFIFGMTAFLAAILWFVPKDLFTTATWLDNKQLGLLYSGGATAFAKGSFWDITDITVPVSEEAFRFAVMITLLQFLFGYLIGTSGSYISGKSVENPLQFLYLFAKGQVTAANVNWKKMGYWIMFIGIAAFDTYTDWQFSSKYGSADLVLSLVYSLVIYNIASEFALMMGLQLAVGNAPDAIAGFFRTVMAIITSPFKGSGGKQNGQSQQIRPPQNNQGLPQGGQKPQPQNQSRKKGRGGSPQQNGNNRPNPNQPQPRFDPRDPRQSGMNPIVMPGMRLVDDEVDRD